MEGNISLLISLEYSNGWNPLADEGKSCERFQSFRFKLEEIESATQYFFENILLRKNNYCAAYKGVIERRVFFGHQKHQ